MAGKTAENTALLDQSLAADWRGGEAANGGGTSQTLTNLVYSRLREDILMARLRPGRRLLLADLKKLYGVGQSPLREALFRLSAERLVEMTDHRGFRVAPMSVEELIQFTRLRIELDKMAIVEAIENGDDAWEANMVATFHRLSKLAQIDEQWNHWHREFHEAIVAGCNSPILREFRLRMFDLTLRYRQLSLGMTADARDHVAEHREIMEACLQRDAKRASELIAIHSDTTRVNLLRAIEARGGLADGLFD